MPVVLITPEEMVRTPGPEFEILRAAGFDVRYPDDPTFTRGLSGEHDTIRVLRGAEAVLAGGEVLTPNVLEALPDLRVVARAGVGYDRVDIPAATRRGVVVTITPTANHAAVAEHTLALLLAVRRSVVLNDRLMRQGRWERRILDPIRGKTMGLVGLGRIGRSTALRCAALGMKVVAFEPAADVSFVNSQSIELVDFGALLERSDFVSLHCPLSPDTRGLMDARAFARMRRGAVFINTARGGLVVEADLIAALKSGDLGGAGLDVFEREPIDPANPLLAMDNVVVSPHLAGSDAQSLADMGSEAARCIVTLFQEGWPDGAVVNAGLKAGWRWQR